MNNKAQLELPDINWGYFLLFAGIGLGTFVFMLAIWSRMEFEIIWYIKALIGAGILLAAFVFAGIYSD